jgi:hypothetical protein
MAHMPPPLTITADEIRASSVFLESGIDARINFPAIGRKRGAGSRRRRPR